MFVDVVRHSGVDLGQLREVTVTHVLLRVGQWLPARRGIVRGKYSMASYF